MSRILNPSSKQEAGWKRWVASRPEAVRTVAERFDPWSLYRMKSTGHRVTLVSFGEEMDGRVTLTVAVTGNFNLVAFDRQVFGIDPDDLEPCDPPGPDKTVGTEMTHEQVDENIDAIRVRVRPDLWVMNDSGKAVRRH